MKKFLIYLIFIVFMVQPCLGAIDPSMDNRKTYKNAYRWTGKPRDFTLKWAQAVEDALDGTNGVDSLLFSGLSTSAGAALTDEGILFYDTGTDNLKYRNASTLVTLATSTSGTMDETYNQGSGITVDTGTIALTGTDALNAEVLAIVHAETGAYPAFSISNAGTDPTIEITTSGSGADITGTSATWSFSKTGAFTLSGSMTLSTVDVLFDATSAGEDIQYDHSADLLHVLDGAAFGIGGAVNAAADMVFESDGTNVLVEVATQDDADLIFGATEAFDFKIHANTATDYALFDGSGSGLVLTDYDIWLDDTATLFIGGTKNVGFNMIYTASKSMSILAGANSDDFVLNIGVDQSGVDLKTFGTTASAYMLWDSTADALWFDKADIALGQTDYILFGDTMGTGDLSLGTSADAILSFGQVVADVGQIYFGVADDGIDCTWFGDAGTGSMVWSEAGNTNGALIFNNSDIEMGDGDFIQFGDGADLTVSATTTTTTMTMAAGSDLDILDTDDTLSKIILGLAGGTHGLDIQWNSITAADTVVFDAGAESVTFTGVVAVLDDGSFAFGDGDAILMGDTLGTGDWSIASTSAVLAFTQVAADTGTVTWGADNVGVDVTWYGEDASAYMKWEGNGTANNTLNLVGIDSSDTLLKLTGVNTTTDSDSMTIAHGGGGDGIQITIGNTDGVAINAIAAAAQTTSLIHLDADTSNWDGATNVGMLQLVADDAFIHANASMIMAVNSGTPIANAGGFMLRLADSGSNQASTAYAFEIETTSNEAMHIDSGTVLVDETITCVLGCQSNAVAVTANTASQAGSLIAAGVRVVVVSGITADSDDFVVIPAGSLGDRITIIAEAAGSAFEIRTVAGTGDTINEQDCDGTKEYAVTHGDIVDLICTEAGVSWVGVSHTILGAAKTIIPD